MKKKKVLFIAIGVCICIIIGIWFVKHSTLKNNSIKQDNISIQYNIENIINDLGSKFICIKKSEEFGFKYDVYLNFKEDIYVGNKSNETLYKNLISRVISDLKNNVRFIDESRDLIIRVTFDENRYFYTVNGEEDYFKKIDSINTLSNKKEDRNIDIRVDSNELSEIISNNWQKNSIKIDEEKRNFDGYDIFFDSGIYVKNIMSKVYNVIFNKKYNSKVINGITVGMDKSDVIKRLGEPIFEQGNIYGYKNNDMYIFFSENEISIYRNEYYDTQEFSKLLIKYINKEINLKKFMNELTYLWDDYFKYEYSAKKINIEYPLKGLKIDMEDSENSLGIEIYENFDLNEDIKKLIKDKKIIGKLDNNLVQMTEIERCAKISNEMYLAEVFDYSYSTEEKTISKLYKAVYEKNTDEQNIAVRFYLKKENIPFRELRENINTLLWISDTEIIYSIKNIGIYYYDIQNNIKQELLKGTDDFNLISYKNNILKYDSSEIQIKEE